MTYLMDKDLILELLQQQADAVLKQYPTSLPLKGFKWKAIPELTLKGEKITWVNKWVAEPLAEK